MVTNIQRAKGWATCIWRGAVLRGRCCEHNDASGSGTGGKHLEAGVSDSNNVLRGPYGINLRFKTGCVIFSAMTTVPSL